MKLLPKLLILTATCVPLVVSCSETKKAVATTAGEVAAEAKEGADTVVGEATESRSVAINITGMK